MLWKFIRIKESEKEKDLTNNILVEQSEERKARERETDREKKEEKKCEEKSMSFL